MFKFAEDVTIVVHDPSYGYCDSFKVLATVITIVNCDSTVFTFVNYNRKTFIEQATDVTSI